jgi:hypothetical protein
MHEEKKIKRGRRTVYVCVYACSGNENILTFVLPRGGISAGGGAAFSKEGGERQDHISRPVAVAGWVGCVGCVLFGKCM